MTRIRKKEFTQYLESALPFDVWVGSERRTVKEARDYIFDEIGETYRLAKKKYRDREALLVILLNLWIGFFVGKPIRISMDSNFYSLNNVFGKLFFKYKRMKRLIDSLKRHGYLERKEGFQDKWGRQTRIWATVKLIEVFVEKYKIRPIGDINTTQSPDLVQLRNEYKIKNKKTKRWEKISEDVPFTHTEKTLGLKANLEKFNTLSNEEKITVCLEEDDLINLEDLTGKILTGLIKGKIELVNTELVCKESKLQSKAVTVSDDKVKAISDSSVNDGTQRSNDEAMITSTGDATETGTGDAMMEELDVEVLQYQHYKFPIALYKSMVDVALNKTYLLYTITHTLHSPQYQGLQPKSVLFLHMLWIKKLLSLMKTRSKKDEFMKEDRPLADFGIKKLEFEIKIKDMHRVFNRASKKFDKGGRFYGPYYQGIPSKFRKSILINGKKTTEYDYSGLHIRMLYHRLGLKFIEDPYSIGDGSLREEYKLVSLISINAKKQGAHFAVRDALEDAGFAIADDLGAVMEMMKNFQTYHAPIEEFLFSGAGIDLQNKDSHIMNEILMRLHDQGICGLPIHDSVIVEKEYSELLQELMIQVYEEVMNFMPVLKIAN